MPYSNLILAMLNLTLRGKGHNEICLTDKHAHAGQLTFRRVMDSIAAVE